MLKMTKKISKNDQNSSLSLTLHPSVQKESNPQWNEIKVPSNIISRRCNHTSCIYQNKLFIYGGYDSNTDGILSDFHVYSMRENRWEKIESENGPGFLHSHSAVIYKDRMYLFGGMSKVLDNTNSFYQFDFSSRKWLKVQAKGQVPAIDSHKACVIGDQMIIFSGFIRESFNKNVHSFNFITQEWSILFVGGQRQKQMPRSRSFCSLNVYKNGFIIYGGKDMEQVFNDIWFFDLQKRAFSPIVLKGSLSDRYGHSGVIFEEKLFVFGGTDGVTHQKNDLVVIDLVQKQKVCFWEDTQSVITKQKKQTSPALRKTLRESCKKIGQIQKLEDNESSQINQIIPKKYRYPLKEVNYYNQLFERTNNLSTTNSKFKKNPFLSQLHEQKREHMVLTSTYEALTNSVLCFNSKVSNRENDKSEIYTDKRKIPKARDNYSCNFWSCQEGNPFMIIFGGSMHKICLNDLIVVNLAHLIRKNMRN